MDAASVSLHGVRVGTLERVDEDTQEYLFCFDPDWLADPNRPTLGQLFEDRRPDDIRTSGFPCWFDHLLPQGPSRRLLRRVAGLDDDHDGFDLLLSVGMDLPGALVIEPMRSRSAVRQSRDTSVEPPADPHGFTLPGAQNKLSMREGEGGLVVSAAGDEGRFIAKFDDPRFPGLPTLEFATTQWAVNAGIRAHEIRMVPIAAFASLPEDLPTGDGQVLLASRFDRSPAGRIHAEDFGQILDIPAGDRQYHAGYEELARSLLALSPDDVREFVERLVFMIVAGNGDAHLKNWGVIYPDRRHPRLGPAYDLVATVARVPREDLALTLGDSRRFEQLRLDSFAKLAAAIDRDETEVQSWIREQLERSLDAWATVCRTLPLQDCERAAINRHMERVPLLRTR